MIDLIYLVIISGFIGGAIRALIGFWQHGFPERIVLVKKRRKKRSTKQTKISWVPTFICVVTTGIIGIFAATAIHGIGAFSLVIGDAVTWKTMFCFALSAYVIVDILNSYFKIIQSNRIEM